MGYSRLSTWTHLNKYLKLSGLLDKIDTLPHYGTSLPEENYFGKTMLELGCQSIKWKVRASLNGKTGIAKEYFDSVGIPCVSIDITGCRGALQVDLRELMSDEFHDRFDIITNVGTTEHVEPLDTQYQAFKNIHLCCKVNGVMIHLVPLSGKGHVGHCPVYYTFEFFRRLALLNDYEIICLEEFVRKEPDFLIGACLRKRQDNNFTEAKDELLQGLMTS